MSKSEQLSLKALINKSVNRLKIHNLLLFIAALALPSYSFAATVFSIASVSQDDGTAIYIEIVEPSGVETIFIKNPNRYVVDISNMKNKVPGSAIQLRRTPLVLGLRQSARSGKPLRLVFDLSDDTQGGFASMILEKSGLLRLRLFFEPVNGL